MKKRSYTMAEAQREFRRALKLLTCYVQKIQERNIRVEVCQMVPHCVFCGAYDHVSEKHHGKPRGLELRCGKWVQI